MKFLTFLVVDTILTRIGRPGQDRHNLPSLQLEVLGAWTAEDDGLIEIGSIDPVEWQDGLWLGEVGGG